KFMGTVRFRNDHVAAIMGFGDLQWGNILITRVYFIEGLGLPKFKYHKKHLCPSCEQGKSKRASHPPKPVPNSRHRLHLLHIDLCGPMRIASINGKRYVLVIVDDYSRYTWVHFLRSKDEAPEVIIKFLKRITVLLQKPDILFLHVFGALCYPKNDRKDIGKLGAKATARTVPPAQEPQDVDELNPNATFDGNTFVNPFAKSSTSAAASSSSQNVDPSNMHIHDLVAGLSKFKYHKEHLCPSCEQGKSKRASHIPKPVPNSRQRLHLLHMDLCGPMRIASINGKRYILVIVDDYSRYTWVHFLRSKDEAPTVIITFLKRITVLLQSPVIIIRTDNGTEFKNQVLKVYFDSVDISHQMSSVRTPQQNRVVERRNRTLVEAART
nr:retrovirus-related Pol polyprotein from transposon TNT 1-94 [Tanacetum cinerariifolium]